MNGAELTLLAAFFAGLLGSGHCLGMCGGIAGSIGVSRGPRSPVRGLSYSLLFNTGRIGSYGVAGLIAGGLGFLLAGVIDVPAVSISLRMLTGLLMLGIGLQFALDWRGLRRIEALGGALWRRIAPLTRPLLPVRNARSALLLGMLWGWLPCGLVYTMLAAAATSGAPAQGALLMMSFGWGTLPAMLGVAALAGPLLARVSKLRARRVGGVLLAGFGVWTIVFALMPLLSAAHAHAGHAM